MKKQFALIGLVGLAINCSTVFADTPKIVRSAPVIPNPSCSELLKTMHTASHSFYSDDSVEKSSLVFKLNEIYKGRSVSRQRRINATLTALHAQNEMTFQTKNPKTGFYDKFTAVPVNGIVAPISETKFNSLVQSTAPLMRFLRSLLQKVYSAEEFTPEKLALFGLPPADAARAIQIIKESIYLEPALRSPVMKDYPFLSVGGFDGAIGDPSHPEPIFYEMNLGTPSGLSNNTYLQTYLKTADPEVYSTIEPSLSANSTFKVLRRAIEDNARAWTGDQEGFTVVISPGVYNGAHPDVAAIAKYSGMPLVHASDLYEDADGNIRLNDGPKWAHRIVTGIYGRTEESYFFQSSADNIAMVAPYYVDVNNQLNAKLHLNLRPGAIYSYIKDDGGNIVDVEKDEHAQPILQPVWDSIGQDPYRPNAPRGSFARAVVNRKLYFSGLGGRVVDDKRIFRLVSQLFSSKDVARPVQGLNPDQLEPFFANPLKYVVKEPANSGGVGVYFLAMVDETKREEIIERVRLHPHDFEIQDIREVTVLPNLDGRIKSDTATDLRLFVTMNSDGIVAAGPQSVLLRTAQNGSLFTNTSQGGGYGIAVVYKDDPGLISRVVNFFAPTQPQEQETSLPVIEKNLINVAESHAKDLSATVEEAIRLAVATDPANTLDTQKFKDLQTEAENLSYQIRSVLDLIPGNATILASACRDFAGAKRQTPAITGRFHAQLLGYLTVVSTSLPNVPYDVQDDVQSVLNKSSDALQKLGIEYANVEHDRVDGMRIYQSKRSDPPLIENDSKIVIRTFAEPDIISSSKDGSKAEVAEYIKVDDPLVQSLIDEVKAVGGEVRVPKRIWRARPNARWEARTEPPYFWVNISIPGNTDYMKPVVALDLERPMSLASLRHEMGHFYFWKAFYDKYRTQGLSHQEACKLSVADIDDPMNWVASEHAAVAAEMKSQIEESTHPYNRPGGVFYSHNFYEIEYVNRVTYPEFEGIRLFLMREEKGQPLEAELVKKLMQDMIQVAETTRKRAIAYLSDEHLYKDKMSKPQADYLLNSWRVIQIQRLIMYPYGTERLNAKLLERFKELLFKEIEASIAAKNSEVAPAEKAI